MTRPSWTGVAALCALLIAGCAPRHTSQPQHDGGPGTCDELDLADADDDGIPDVDEGGGAVDTDGDGRPDSRDEDSDNDGHLDVDESYMASCDEDPADHDEDGVPDFMDLDSDDNGIRDQLDGIDDPDGDLIPNFGDTDDDGDGISDRVEVGPDAADAADSDGDGIPDFHDTDSDNDGIPDSLEGPGDIDEDGRQNFRDTDSDGDGFSDRDEGSSDCDGDGLLNFVDRDSDGDGLEDAAELALRTDPCDDDTDDDGLTDLVERAIGTDPTDGSSAIGEDEYFVVLPYLDEPIVRDLEFTTNIKQADVYFILDTTGSMWEEQEQLRSSLSGFIVPEVAAIVPDVQFGVGRHDDIPYGSFGGGGDVGYENVHEISGDIASVQAAIEDMGSGGGADSPESQVIALYAIATGDGVETDGVGEWVEPSPGCLEGRFGYPCFRPYSLPVILEFTDCPFHNGPPEGTSNPYGLAGLITWLDSVAALNDIGAKVLGFSSDAGDYCGAYADLEATAIATGAVRMDGTPLAWRLSSDGRGLDESVVEAIADLSTQVARDVNTTVEESPVVDDGIDAADFIQSVVPLRANPEDGVRDFDETTFYDCEAGTLLTFTVTFQNDLVPEGPEPLVFTARIVVLGDDTVRLDDRRVIILVPPEDIPIG